MAQEQLGKPLGEAYQALGLPGNPEDAAEVFYLHAEDCVKVLGKQMDVAIVHLGKDEEDKKGHYIRQERYSGAMSRTFYVGEDVKQEDIKAKFENGILSLSVPKPVEQKKVETSKHIAIEG